MNATVASLQPDAPALDTLRRYKDLFDGAWTMAAVLAASLTVLCRYFELVSLSIGPIILVLAAMVLAQWAINAFASGEVTERSLGRATMLSQLVGTLCMGVAWHLFGGVQQPLFPLFIVLPLLPAAGVLGFWQQQLAAMPLLLVLATGILLSPDTNSFIEARYGFVLAPERLLGDWLPRSHTAFPDMNTSPSYNLVLTATMGVVGIAASTAARALVAVWRESIGRVAVLQQESGRLQAQLAQIIDSTPAPTAVVAAASGRIVNASGRFLKLFELQDARGAFLLDIVSFTYPAVVRRLVHEGGEEIQAAKVAGRELVLRLRSEVIGDDAARVAILSFETCEDLCWRSEVDALEVPLFAVDSHGRLAFPNRAARELLAEVPEGAPLSGLFESQTLKWWEIAPLPTARRVVTRANRRYVASLRRERIAASIGEHTFVSLHRSESGIRLEEEAE